jgi:hypothetical protein
MRAIGHVDAGGLNPPGRSSFGANQMLGASRARVSNVFKSFASTAITAGTGMTIWTPAPARSSA